VRFIDDGIDGPAYRGLASRAGQEATESP